MSLDDVFASANDSQMGEVIVPGGHLHTDRVVEAGAPGTGEQGGAPRSQALRPAPPGDEFVLRLPGLDDVELGPREGDRVRAIEMRGRFEENLPDEWRERYFDLARRFGRWEIAALVLWSSLPKEVRVPRTQNELAREVFGLTSDRVVGEWKCLPGVEDEIKATRTFALFDYVPDTFKALGELATHPDYRNIPAMRLLFEMTGHYVPSQEVNVGVPRWVRDAADETARRDRAALAASAEIPVEE